MYYFRHFQQAFCVYIPDSKITASGYLQWWYNDYVLLATVSYSEIGI